MARANKTLWFPGLFYLMANPQKENGYTAIANEIMDALAKMDLSSSESRILRVVLRKTYGWNKPNDQISLSQFQKLTSLSRQMVCHAIKLLVKRGLLGSQTSLTRKSTKYWFIKDYEKWMPSQRHLTSQTSLTISSQAHLQKVVKPALPTKDIITKDNIKTRAFYGKFQEIWSKYPNKDGRKAAERHFYASVKTDQDWADINKALTNYLSSGRVQKNFIKNGSTWFNGWRDWVDFKEDVCSKCKGKGVFTSTTGFEIVCKCPAGNRVNK